MAALRLLSGINLLRSLGIRTDYGYLSFNGNILSFYSINNKDRILVSTCVTKWKAFYESVKYSYYSVRMFDYD